MAADVDPLAALPPGFAVDDEAPVQSAAAVDPMAALPQGFAIEDQAAPQTQPGGADTVATDPLAHTMPYMGSPVQHTGYAAQVARTMSGNGPAPYTEGPKPFGTIAGEYGDIAKSVPVGMAAGTLGIPGDLETLGRGALSKFTSISPTNVIPNTNDIGNDIAGHATNGYQTAGRLIGSFLAPAAITKTADGIRALSDLARTSPASDAIAQAASAARQAGYVLPPNMASNNPGIVSQFLNGVAGKIKTQQLASTKNADVTNALAAKTVGLPEDQPITEAALEQVRANAGQAYNAVRKAPIQIIPDQQFSQDIAAIDQRGAAARAEVPGLVKNPDLDDLNENMAKITQLSPDASVDAIQSLRYQAKTNLKNYASPEKLALGRTQSQAANALEGLVERNLQAATTARGPIGAQGGDMSQLVDQLQQARTTIAKTYSIEAALNPATGNVDAQKLAALQAKGTPLTGGLAQSANAATAFPKALQNPSKFGGNENVSVLDAAMSLGMEHAGGGPAAFAWLAGRPAIRHLILSNLYQNAAIPVANAAQGGAAAQRLLSVPSISDNPVLRNLMLQRLLSGAQQSQPAQ